jgi:hypothetical protein
VLLLSEHYFMMANDLEGARRGERCRRITCNDSRDGGHCGGDGRYTLIVPRATTADRDVLMTVIQLPSCKTGVGCVECSILI